MKPSGFPFDAISPQLLKEVFPIQGPSNLIIINSSLISGMVSKKIKHATV